MDDDESEIDDNPHQFSICIEAHDLADMPLPSTLTLARETLNELPSDGMPPEIIHLDVHSTGVPMELQAFDKFYDRLIHLLAFVDDQASRGRRILIHCSDGYTETSLMLLSWIMYKEKVRLPEAYLILQRKRSFFVYSVDVPTLRRIEYQLGQTSADQHKRKRESDPMEEDGRLPPKDTRQNVKDLHVGSTASTMGEIDEDDEEEDDEDDEMHVKDNRLLHDDTYINNVSNYAQKEEKNACFTPPVPGRPVRTDHYQALDDIDETIPVQSLAPEPDAAEKALFPWFYSPRFEGSFPSRILPFLYLGNLNHATNPDMLKALGITHVVSVGEDANLDQSQFNLLFLDNLYDDGIDSIRSRLEETMRFVGTRIV